MKTKLFTSGFSLILLLTVWGCKKNPGEGGNSAIRGVLYAQNAYNMDLPATADDYESNQKIYISYGDKATYDDDYSTSYDGSFEFKYLRAGTYKIFAYSTDPVTMSKVPMSRTIELGSNEVYTVNDFVVLKDANDGNATVRGKVYVKDYDHTFENINAEYYASEEDVYIIYGEGSSYNDKTKTAYDGSFQFSKLRKGSYKIYVMSDDPTRQNPDKIPMMVNVGITKKDQTIVLSDIVKYK